MPWEMRDAKERCEEHYDPANKQTIISQNVMSQRCLKPQCDGNSTPDEQTFLRIVLVSMDFRSSTGCD